jgi:hypothetical protein
MLEDPSNEFGWQADQDSLDEILATIQEALDMPTTGAPAVVAFCTDGSRAAQVAVTFTWSKLAAGVLAVAWMCRRTKWH